MSEQTESAMRKAMDAVDAIAAMADATAKERMDAFSRISNYALKKWNQELPVRRKEESERQHP
jgi:hypothetical protein